MKYTTELPEDRDSTEQLCELCLLNDPPKYVPAIEVQMNIFNERTGCLRSLGWKSKKICRCCFQRIIVMHNNPVLTRLLAEEGIARSYHAAEGIFTDCLREIVLDVLRMQPEINADDVWPIFEVRYPAISHMHNWDALGGVMAAMGSGPGKVMVRTGRTVESTRPRTHGKPQRIWRSLLYIPD